jgi:cephalosporin hydroxylase
MGLDTRLFCIDVEQREQVTDPRITFVHGDARNLGAVLTDEVLAGLPRPWLVVEDADHHAETCLAVLRFFAPLLNEGEYLCVEDGLCDSVGTADRYDGGPNRALDEYLAAHPGIYAVDAEYCDYFGNNMTWCTNGWLRRTAAPLSQ